MFAIGTRVEIPAHYDLWMRGARFGVIVKATPDRIKIRMDHSQVRKLVTIPAHDYDYVKAL